MMTYTSFSFYILVGLAAFAYYLIPVRFRWTVLLAASAVFYYLASGRSRRQCALFLGAIVVSYLFGLILEQQRYRRKTVLVAGLVVCLLPLLLTRVYGIVWFSIPGQSSVRLLVSLGLAFWSLQIAAYLIDVYRGKVQAQRNPAKYALFVSFFPQVMQGPIPRYDQLEHQLVEGHRFKEENIVRGYILITWGFFLKYMIADKAGIVVDTVFNDSDMYLGGYALTAGILYSIQLYADFLACTTISQGVARLFDISIIDNFSRPYFATSAKDFWRRWHISLSSWLRDYIYIPLGGNRKEKFRKYLNIVITFAVSGIWHGNGIQFLAWGLLHAFYQLMGDWLKPFRNAVKKLFGVKQGSRVEQIIARVITFFLVMFAWILFRAGSLKQGLKMILSVFTVRNPWIFWNDSILDLGLSWKEWGILLVSILTLYIVGRKQERGVVITDRLLVQPLFVRWICYIGIVIVVMVFGTYGFGYNASDFIYMNF